MDIQRQERSRRESRGKRLRHETWRLLPFHVGSTAYHVALSDALVRHARTPTLWWHATDHPTLLLGTGQLWSEVDTERAQTAGVRIVKRHAGGTAVYAAPGVLGLDAALPAGHPLAVTDVVESYRWLGEVWVEATRALGAQSRLATIGEARSKAREERPYSEIIRLACFGSLSPYEVVVGTKKLVGLAQVRRRGGVLLQAGLHLHFDAGALVDVLPTQDRSAVTTALTMAALGLNEATDSDPREQEVIEVFNRTITRMLSIQLRPSEWTDEEMEHVRNRFPDLARAEDVID